MTTLSECRNCGKDIDKCRCGNFHARTDTTPNDTFAHAAKTARPGCPKCRGTGVWKYDHNHSTICDLCCQHDLGWWKLEEHYGKRNGKWCCRAGCGKIVDEPPNEDQQC